MFDNGGWEGNSGWGAYLGFAQVEVKEIEHAITYLKVGDKLIEFDGYGLADQDPSKFDATLSYYTFTEQQSLEVGKTSVVGLFEKLTMSIITRLTL